MSPSFTHLNTLSSKVDTKLQNIKCRMHKTKAADLNLETTVEPKSINMEQSTTTKTKITNEERVATAEPNYAGVDGEENNSPLSSQASQKSEKNAKREARREARKAKWATRRAAFMTKAKKVAKASLLAVEVVVTTAIAPALIAFSIVTFVIRGVVWLVIKIVDVMGAFLFAFLW